MWVIYEKKNVLKVIRKLPPHILEKYEFWKNVMEISGPLGIKAIKGFRDEALKGNLEGFRSSSLNIQYRVIYKILKDEIYVEVEDITPHDYKRNTR